MPPMPPVEADETFTSLKPDAVPLAEELRPPMPPRMLVESAFPPAPP